MPAIELFHQDGKPAGIFYCSNCMVVASSQDMAESCCGERLCACGKPIASKHRAACYDCDNKAWHERMDREEMARFKKAAKVNAADYTGDRVFWGDDCFESIEEAIERAEDGGGPVPKYLWAAKNQGVPEARIDDLLDRLIEGMWEDADYNDLNGIPELEKAIAEFNEANRGTPVWMVDFSTAIVIPEGYGRGE